MQPVTVESDERRTRILALFRRNNGGDAAGVAFAPGRVNLIGEHIDYHGGPVLPAALARGISVAWAPRTDGAIRAVSVFPDGSSSHPSATFEVGAIGEAAGGGGWANYVKAAASMATRSGDSGADLVVTSDLPEASGLSSSSALVVATGLALLSAGGRIGEMTEARRLDLATQFAEAERFVGTAGGGMDQAASLGGRAGHALRIDFNPLRWRHISFPKHLVLIVAHSGVRAEKSGSAQARYNEIRAARNEPDVAEHIRTEIERVGLFESALLRGDVETCGGLMDASHESLRDRLRVSHPALDEMVTAARSAGVLGARMTGAGFGGSIVCLTDSKSSDSVVEALRSVQARYPGAQPAFVARPGEGASVWLRSE